MLFFFEIKNKKQKKMQPGSMRPLTPTEVKEAFEHAPYTNEYYAVWRDSNNCEHRSGDLPARIYKDGAQYWCRHGKWHRDNGLPALIRPNGVREWFEHGEYTGNDRNPPPNAPEIFFFQPGQKTKSASKC